MSHPPVAIVKEFTPAEIEAIRTSVSSADNECLLNMLETWGQPLLNEADNSFPTTLQIAAACKNPKILQIIIEYLPEWRKKIALNTCNERHDAPLHKAVDNGHVRNVEILLDNDVDVEKPDRCGRTALFSALNQNTPNMKIVKLLLSKGAAINQPNWVGDTVLHLAVLRDDANCIAEILKNGGEVDKLDACGKTALQLAIPRGHTEVIATLLNNGASTKSLALPLVAEKCSACIVDAILRRGAKVDAVDKYGGRTALHHAVLRGKLEMVQILLTNAATIDQVTSDGKTALHLAINNGHANIIELLLHHGAANDPMALRLATQLGRVHIIAALLRRGADVDAVDERGWTALHFAASNQKQYVIEVLLAHGASINKKTLKNESPIDLVGKSNWHVESFLRNRGGE